jgi:hypothetical protein
LRCYADYNGIFVSRYRILSLTLHTGNSNKYTDRLETEHIGNMDQYRVNREIPLPYAFDLEIREEDRDTLTAGKR